MLKVKVIERGPLDEKVKQARQIYKGALQDGVRLWHRTMLPGHFVPQEQFAAKYGAAIPGGYVKRSAKYLKRKAILFGHRRNLEFRGEMKRNVLTQLVVSGTANKATGRLPGSQKANFKRSAAAPNMRMELVVTLFEENQRLAEFVEALIARELNSNQPVKVTNI